MRSSMESEHRCVEREGETVMGGAHLWQPWMERRGIVVCADNVVDAVVIVVVMDCCKARSYSHLLWFVSREVVKAADCTGQLPYS